MSNYISFDKELITCLFKQVTYINMKRKGNLYKNICKFDNILSAYNEVCKNTRNKRRVANLKEYKSIYISEGVQYSHSQGLRGRCHIISSLFTSQRK